MKAQTVRVARGQSLIEFALIFPLLLIIVFFIVDFGRAIYYSSALFNAAREGARYGTSAVFLKFGGKGGLNNVNRPLIIAAAKQHLYGVPDTPGNPVTITLSISEPGDIYTQYLHVRASYCFYAITPIVSRFTGTGCFPLTSEARMRIETRLPPP